MRPDSAFTPRPPKVLAITIVSLGVAVCLVYFYVLLRMEGHRDRLERLEAIVVVQAHAIAEIGYSNDPDGDKGAGPGAAAWPWGQHTTPDLDHLAAAAAQWWVTYDPEDPATAPTNEMVIDWLVSERGASKDKAKAIASILRPPGLKAGRRPKSSDGSEGSTPSS